MVTVIDKERVSRRRWLEQIPAVNLVVRSINTEGYENGGGKDDKIQLKGCSRWEHIFRFGKYEMHGRSVCACMNVGVSTDICRGSKKICGLCRHRKVYNIY